MNELKKWFASSKATDGMLCYCVKRGGMTKKKNGETHHKHLFMGAGKYDNKHGDGVSLIKKWKQRTIDTEHINERAISTTTMVNRQRIKRAKRSRSTLKIAKDTFPTFGGDFNAEWDLDTEMNVTDTLSEGNKRGDWMKHWMMLQATQH